MESKNTYKQLTAFVFIAAFVAQTFSGTFIIADYYTNTAKYAKNCENKAKRTLHCDGKCQMMKKLREEEKNNASAPATKANNRVETTLSSKSFAPFLPSIGFLDLGTKAHSPISDNKIVDRSLSIFHPPQL